MKAKINQLCISLSLIANLGGCASPNTLAVFEEGPIRVQSTFVNSYLRDPDGWSGTVNAKSTDGHDEIAQRVNQALQAAGYKVPDQGQAQVIYSITELYAGPALGYVEKNGAVADTIIQTGLSVVGSVAACAALNTCGSSAVVGNEAAQWLTTASVASTNGQGQRNQDDTAANIVVHKVCLSGSCASTIAASADPAVTIDDLRQVNASKGIPRAMRLKCTFKQFGPIKRIDQC